MQRQQTGTANQTRRYKGGEDRQQQQQQPSATTITEDILEVKNDWMQIPRTARLKEGISEVED